MDPSTSEGIQSLGLPLMVLVVLLWHSSMGTVGSALEGRGETFSL